MFFYERLDNLVVVEITLCGVLLFLLKCASKGEIFNVFCLQFRSYSTIVFNACFMCNELVFLLLYKQFYS